MDAKFAEVYTTDAEIALRYLTPSIYNKNFMEVDCDLFSEHLKENGFELMIDFTSNEGKTRREIFWNKKNHMLCCLQTDDKLFTTCHLMFEIECVYDEPIVQMRWDIGASTSCYRKYGIKAYVFYLKWQVDIKATANTFQKLLDKICIDDIKIGSNWEGYHVLNILFGTPYYNYNEISSGCPEDWKLLLRKIDANGLKGKFERYADGEIDCLEVARRIRSLDLKPEQIYAYFYPEFSPDNMYPSYTAGFKATLPNIPYSKSEEDRVYDMGIETDVKAFISILEKKFIKYENLSVDIHGLPIGPSYKRVSGTLLPYLKSVGFDFALKWCYPKLYHSELMNCVKTK